MRGSSFIFVIIRASRINVGVKRKIFGDELFPATIHTYPVSETSMGITWLSNFMQESAFIWGEYSPISSIAEENFTQ